METLDEFELKKDKMTYTATTNKFDMMEHLSCTAHNLYLLIIAKVKKDITIQRWCTADKN
jgi:hypothetical protein